MGLKSRLHPAHALGALKRAFPDEGFTAAPAGEGLHEIRSDNPARTVAEISAALHPDAGHVGRIQEARPRRQRNELLAASDWTQLPDAPLSDGQRTAWRIYRQSLRDVPAQKGFPASIAWPEPPISSQSQPASGGPTQ